MPSQKIVSFIIIIAALLIGIIGFDFIKEKQAQNQEINPEQNAEQPTIPPTVNVAVEVDTAALSKDTDGDGLLDWEEELRGSDIENPDTDGDGTPDGEEVDAGRNPTVSGPDDVIETTAENTTATSTDTSPSNITFVEGTLSESVATNFISGFFNLSSQDTASVDYLATQIAQDALEIATIPDAYSIADITTFPDYEKDRIRDYGNAFSNIAVVYFAAFSSIDNPDEEVYINLIALIFESFALDLSALSVPVGIVDQHLAFINNTNRVGKALRALNESDTDPITAFFALNQYEQVAQKQVDLFGEIADYFAASDIIFTDEETGIMWHNF